MRDELTAIPGITQVDIVSAPPDEISIEVSGERPSAARAHVRPGGQRGAPLVARPAGRVGADGEGRDLLLRTIGQAYRGAEFE